MSVLSAPVVLWQSYVEHLWHYQPGSWVHSAASSFRILAFLVIAPFILLTLLDVTSYVIARTLGVIDDTKASTSETGSASEIGTPSIVIQHDTAPNTLSAPTTTPSSSFFRHPLVEEGNLKLSGVGMFSPAPSQPPSPTMSRRELTTHMHNVPEEAASELKAESRRDASRDSSSGESSYAMLEPESGSEDTQVTLRRRMRNAAPSSGPSES